MIDYESLLIDRFTSELESAYQKTYGSANPAYSDFLAWTGRLALENINNSDMLYHNADHPMLVTLVGQEVLIGKHLSQGEVTPQDWVHFIVALLCHDIGYVRGVCRDDRDCVCATGVDGRTVEIPEGGTDAVLTPYHVDRSKQFIRERFGSQLLLELDVETVTSYIEMTRFPPPDDPAYQETRSYAALVRAADFIGQLGDPHYLRKIPALFYEFEETGANEKVGYKNPGDMRDKVLLARGTAVSRARPGLPARDPCGQTVDRKPAFARVCRGA